MLRGRFLPAGPKRMPAGVNRISPGKLLHSKWTAVAPTNKEKHFIVTAVHSDANGVPQTCTLEAVHSGRESELDWRELRDNGRWQIGWQ